MPAIFTGNHRSDTLSVILEIKQVQPGECPMIFDFEEWAQLAKQDQAAFERKRAATIKQAIEDSAHSERERRMLHGLQFRVDMVRRKHKHALGACIEISDMLMDHFYQLAHLDMEDIVRQATPPDQDSNCRILPFKPVSDRNKRNS